MENLQDITICS